MNDVDKCINEILKHLHRIEEPEHVSNVHSWMIKLTTGEQSVRKMDYLLLLEYMLKSDEGVQEPFTSAPPHGMLQTGICGLARPPKMDRDEFVVGYSSCTDDDMNTCSVTTTASEWPSVCSDDRHGPVMTATVPACPELVGLVRDTNTETASLQRFMADVQRYTCDGGRLMRRVVDQLLAEFGRSSAAVFDEHTQKLSDALATEQFTLLLRFRTNTQRMFSRAQILQDHLRELLPTFRYDEFTRNPDEHIRRLVMTMNRRKAAAAATTTTTRCNTKSAGVDADAEDSDAEHSDAEHSDAEHSDGDNDDDEASAARAQQEKQIQGALDWLRSEVERIDCENATLSRRRDVIVTAISMVSETRITDGCQAMEQKREAKAKLDLLRKRSAEQKTIIDSYVERIRLMNRDSNDVAACL